MITKDIFKLDNYYIVTNKYYYFFDGMFKVEKKHKLKELEKLNIPSSTYRVNRMSLEIKNDNHIKLLKEFNVNLRLKDKFECEYVLSELYSCLYYRRKEKVKLLEKKLDKLIEYDNYLKPIFVLFRILTNIINYQDINLVMKIIESDVNYIEKFPIEYFDDEFKNLYWIIMYFVGRNDQCIKEYGFDNKYPHLVWLYHHLRGSYNYSINNYSETIIYYNNAIKCYIDDFNISRAMECQLNVASMYIRIKAYRDAINILMPLIEYSMHYPNPVAFRCYTLMHFLVSLMMIEDYNKIINVMDKIRIERYKSDEDVIEENYINDISAMVGIIACKKMKKEVTNKLIKARIESSKEVKEIYNYLYYNESISDEFLNRENVFYEVLIKDKIEICQ